MLISNCGNQKKNEHQIKSYKKLHIGATIYLRTIILSYKIFIANRQNFPFHVKNQPKHKSSFNGFAKQKMTETLNIINNKCMIFDPDVKILHNFLITFPRLPPWWRVAWWDLWGSQLADSVLVMALSAPLT